jgi:hypothetical protein
MPLHYGVACCFDDLGSTERGCRDLGVSSVNTQVAATRAVARPPSSLDLAAVALAPSREPAVGRWPGWMRLAILIGGSAALWIGLGWIALRILKLS